jgi:hypothetical protein
MKCSNHEDAQYYMKKGVRIFLLTAQLHNCLYQKVSYTPIVSVVGSYSQLIVDRKRRRVHVVWNKRM